MAVEMMGNYGKEYAKVSETQQLRQKNKANTKTTLDMNDFIKLMAAQLRHQDMNNPLNEAEMMAQMAQMATVQAMTEFSQIAVTNYSASLVGREVSVAGFDENDELQQIIGTVTGAGLYNGKQIVFVGGKSYNLNQIMAIGELPDADEKAIRVDEKGNKVTKKKDNLPPLPKKTEEELLAELEALRKEKGETKVDPSKEIPEDSSNIDPNAGATNPKNPDTTNVDPTQSQPAEGGSNATDSSSDTQVEPPKAAEGSQNDKTDSEGSGTSEG